MPRAGSFSQGATGDNPASSCPECGSKDLDRPYDDWAPEHGGFTVVPCNHCGHESVKPARKGWRLDD